MNTLLPTCDLNLDGTGLCPGHALFTRGQYPQLSDWCEGAQCEGCSELYWEGQTSASKVFEPYQHDTAFLYEESWKTRLDDAEKNSSLRRKPYWDGYNDYIRSKMNVCIENKEKRKSVLEATDKLTRELGPREFTLTYSPSWFETDELAQHAMRLAIERLLKYYKDELHEFHAVGEYTDAGNSHIHAWYHLIGGHKITDKNFKRAWPHWNPKKKLGRGFEGGHHQTINRLSDFAGYIEKHFQEAWLVIDTNADQEDNIQEASPGDASSQGSEEEDDE